jgi:hypothetical protein
MRCLEWVGAALLTMGLTGCDGCTYYVEHTCRVRVSVRAADGRTDVPCQIDLVPVGQSGAVRPQLGHLGQVNEYPVTVAWRSASRGQSSAPSHVIVNCSGYEQAEGPAFSFHVAPTGCPTVESGELVVRTRPVNEVR